MDETRKKKPELPPVPDIYEAELLKKKRKIAKKDIGIFRRED